MKQLNQLEMSDLIDEARKQGLWLYCSYQNLWFSPDELTAAQEQGRFRWGVMNWALRDPKIRLEDLDNAIDRAKEEYNKFYARVCMTK